MLDCKGCIYYEKDSIDIPCIFCLRLNVSLEDYYCKE